MAVANDGEGAGRGRGEGSGGWLGPALIYGGAALVGAALFQAKRSAAAQEAHPPVGRFIKVDGTTVHYVDAGSGPPVVLLHGLGTTLEDFIIAGLVDELLPLHRVIAVDRPGYGYSERPGRVEWTPERQATLLAKLLHRLGAHDAVIVGHSYGVLPALMLALQQPQFVRSLVLVSGIYLPGSALTQASDALPSLPGLGALARATVTPSLARATLPSIIDAAFEPQPVPKSYWRRFPMGLVTRPGQLRAAAEDGAMAEDAVRRLLPHYGALDKPMTIICGSGDALIDPDTQSRPFAEHVGHARLIVVPAMGHMVHHSASARVAAAILDTFSDSVESDDPGGPPEPDLGDLPDPDAEPDADEAEGAAQGATEREAEPDADEAEGAAQGATKREARGGETGEANGGTAKKSSRARRSAASSSASTSPRSGGSRRSNAASKQATKGENKSS